MSSLRNDIYVGSLTEPMYHFDNDTIFSISPYQSVSLIGESLSIDTLAVVVKDSFENTSDIYHFQSSDGYEIECADGSTYVLSVLKNVNPSNLPDLEYGVPIWYYQENELVGKFYVNNVERISKNQYQLNLVSGIGMLDKAWHGGGLFQSSTFGAVLRHIMARGLYGSGTPVIDYYVDEDLVNLPVSGWLPHDTKRNNLYQLILANGINIVKNVDGNPRFTLLHAIQENPTPIPDTRIYNGGRVEYIKPYSRVSIFEHTYVEDRTADPVILFDNTGGEGALFEEIWFTQAPIIKETITASENLEIISSSVNGAVISGSGRLTGIPYNHTTRSVFRDNPSGERERTASVQECTMVNVTNSINLLNRLYAFYCSATSMKKIINSFKFVNERCGKAYKFRNPHGDMETAYLASMDMSVTSFNKAEAEFYTGYTPVGQSGLFTHCIVLDTKTFEEDEGLFELPEEVFDYPNPQIRIVMIGGGTGGSSGMPGESGSDTSVYTYTVKDTDITGIWFGGEGGDGGDAGAGGSPGRVKSVLIENPDRTYNYTIGAGGEGGDQCSPGSDIPNAGWSGTASTFGEYSSEDEGSYIPTGGFYDPINSEFYALKGHAGIKGGKGGARQVSIDDQVIWTTDGEDVQLYIPGEYLGDDLWVEDYIATYKGGITGEPMTKVDGLPEAKIMAYGGSGAGAAVGLDRGEHSEMDGLSDQETSWEVVEDGV